MSALTLESVCLRTCCDC